MPRGLFRRRRRRGILGEGEGGWRHGGRSRAQHGTKRAGVRPRHPSPRIPGRSGVILTKLKRGLPPGSKASGIRLCQRASRDWQSCEPSRNGCWTLVTMAQIPGFLSTARCGISTTAAAKHSALSNPYSSIHPNRRRSIAPLSSCTDAFCRCEARFHSITGRGALRREQSSFKISATCYG